jgi:hypothetical protein
MKTLRPMAVFELEKPPHSGGMWKTIEEYLLIAPVLYYFFSNGNNKKLTQ